MGFFAQNITLALSKNTYLVEKVSLPDLKKNNIDLTVVPGTVALVGGMTYKGSEVPYKLTRETVGVKNGAEVYLFPDKFFDGVTVTFFGGQHVVSLSSLKTARAKFSIVGTAVIEVSDYKDLAKYFNRSLTRDDLAQEINKSVKTHLSNETSNAASKFITDSTTEVSLRAALNDVANEIMKSRKTASLLVNMGLLLSARGITFHLNALDDAEDAIKKINDALTDKAMNDLNNDALDRQERKEAADRQFEIDKIRAHNSSINENTDTKNINTNTRGGPVTIVNGENEPRPKFCSECGAKITGAAKFCPECGQKL